MRKVFAGLIFGGIYANMASRGCKSYCKSCFRDTKYECIVCSLPVCNTCSYAELDDDIEGWIAGRSVGYCKDCNTDLALKRNVQSSLQRSNSSYTCTRTNSRYERLEQIRTSIPDCNSGDENDISPQSTSSLNEDELSENVDMENYDGESESSKRENLQASATAKENPKKKKPGRKAAWSDNLLNDMIDIVASNDYYKQKLIFTNTKNQKNGEIYAKILEVLKKRAKERGENVNFTVVQMRTKFKKAIAECKKVALTIKTATGIKRVQDEKEYGPWFQQLFELVKTRDSCQREQSIEPSSQTKSTSGSSSSSEERPKMFVPLKKVNEKGKKEEQIKEVVSMIKQFNENDPMKDFITFAREEAERSRQHELRLTELLMTRQPQPQPGFYNQAVAMQFPNTNPAYPQHPISYESTRDNLHNVDNQQRLYQFQ